MKVQLVSDDGDVIASVDVPADLFVAFALRKEHSWEKRRDARIASELVHMATEVTNPIEDAIARTISERIREGRA